MDFYSLLSRYYDEVFAVNADEMRFAADLLRDRESLLDIGCGTGNKTVFLAENRRRVVAFDNDPGMIGAARRDHALPNIEYLLLDMDGIGAAFSRDEFDAATCLGNTLAHVTGAEDLERVLKAVSEVIAPGGVFMPQILNYNRIMDRNITALPRIETANALFIRTYEWRNGDMHFVTRLEEKASGAAFVNDIVLRPIRKEELAGTLEAAGFGAVDWYGNYKGEPYGEDSFHCIAKAVKKG